MVKISRDPNQVPSWLNVTKTMVPDFVAKNPKVITVLCFSELRKVSSKCSFLNRAFIPRRVFLRLNFLQEGLSRTFELYSVGVGAF